MEWMKKLLHLCSIALSVKTLYTSSEAHTGNSEGLLCFLKHSELVKNFTFVKRRLKKKANWGTTLYCANDKYHDTMQYANI